MIVKKESLRELLSAGEQVVAPSIWDCLSARACEIAGFRAGLVSAKAVSYSAAGLPDAGLLTADEMTGVVARIALASPLALIIDCEGGYGDTPCRAYRTVRRLALAGASAVILSDRRGFSGGERAACRGGRNQESGSGFQTLSRREWLARIKAGAEAVKGTDCMVIAGTESLYSQGLEEAVARCRLARELGAEMLLICGAAAPEECAAINGRLPGWKMYPDLASRGGKPDAEWDTLMENGFNLVTLHCLEKGAMRGMLDYGEHTFADRDTLYIDSRDMADKGVYHWFEQVPFYVDFRRWMDAEKSWMRADD